MRCASCGAAVIEGASRCYRCEAPIQAGAPAPRAAPKKRPLAAVGFGALGVLFVVDVLLLQDSPVLFAATAGYGALAYAAFAGRARRTSLVVAGLGVGLGVFSAAGGGVLVGSLLALASGATLAALLAPGRASRRRALKTSRAEA